MPKNESLPVVRVAIYARVSSEEQREGQTIDSQIAELDRFARAQGWVMVGVYKDEGWSGAVLARPELDRLRDDAKKKLFDVALLNDVDRLARDVSHLGVIKRDLERHGIQVRFRKLPAEQSPTANLMVNILGSFAEFEREMIADRTRRGRRHKVEVRQQFLGSLAPYGYRYVTREKSASRDGYLEIHPEQASVVRQMFQWVDQEGLSARKVVRRLNELGIGPAKGHHSWAKSTVVRILHCETYTGLWHYNKFESYAPTTDVGREYRRSAKYKLRPRPRAEWIQVKLPEPLRIIDRGQWERVQAQLARNLSFSDRNSKHFYLLKGLIKCGGCQARYVGDPNHGRFYYRCHQRCKNYPAVREELLDQAVWEAIEEVLLNPEIVIAQFEKQARDTASMAEAMNREGREVEQGLIQVDEEERRILEAYRTGLLTPAILARELESLKSRRTALLQRRTDLEAQQLRERNLPEIRQSVSETCRQISQGLSAFGDSERQRLLQLLIDSVVFKGDEIRIQGVLPAYRRPDENIASQTVSTFAENPLSQDRTVAPEMSSQGGSNFSYDRITTMRVYSRRHNSVEQIPFEIAKSVSLRKPFWNAKRIRFLRRFLKKWPTATLQESCARMKQDYGVNVSKTEMSRARIRLGFRRNRYQPRRGLASPRISREPRSCLI